MQHAGVIKSRNLKLIEQEGIFVSIHHDKLTDLQTTEKKYDVSLTIEGLLHLYSTDIRFWLTVIQN